MIINAPRNASVIMCTDGVVKRLGSEDFTTLVRQSVIQYMTKPALDKQRKTVKFLDVRLPMEFRAGHIEGSINVPLSRLRDSLQDLASTCVYAISDEAGPRADVAAYILCSAGFEAVVLKKAAEYCTFAEVS